MPGLKKLDYPTNKQIGIRILSQAPETEAAAFLHDLRELFTELVDLCPNQNLVKLVCAKHDRAMEILEVLP